MRLRKLIESVILEQAKPTPTPTPRSIREFLGPKGLGYYGITYPAENVKGEYGLAIELLKLQQMKDGTEYPGYVPEREKEKVMKELGKEYGHDRVSKGDVNKIVKDKSGKKTGSTSVKDLATGEIDPTYTRILKSYMDKFGSFEGLDQNEKEIVDKFGGRGRPEKYAGHLIFVKLE